MSKQQRQIALGLAWLNGGTSVSNDGQSFKDRFTLFEGFPLNYSIWNINYSAEQEFIGAGTKRALSGVERAGISGYRLLIDLSLTNTTTAQTNAIRTLLDASASQYIRRPGWVIEFDSFTFGSQVGTLTAASTTAYPFNVSGSFANAYIYNKTKEQLRLVRGYFATTKNLQFDADISDWEVGDEYEVQLLQNQPTIFGLGYDTVTSGFANQPGPESWSTGLVFCNLVTSSVRINRELTIGTQAVSLRFRSVERFNKIPTKQIL